jgi:hypothetical protein
VILKKTILRNIKRNYSDLDLTFKVQIGYDNSDGCLETVTIVNGMITIGNIIRGLTPTECYLFGKVLDQELEDDPDAYNEVLFSE